MLLSAALIVRNEGAVLQACLSSLANLVDEIVVVDTGSTDAAVEIANACGASVHEFSWTDDFSAARNHALDRAHGDWILSIDADEHVRSGSWPTVREQLSDASHVAYRVLLRPRTGFTACWALRLFRNHRSIRFRGIIHESVWPDIHDYRAAWGGKIGQSGLTLDHEGYEGDQQRKHERNLPLLRRALREDPTSLYCWCHFADIQGALGRDRLAERAWKKAVALVRQKAVVRRTDSLPYTGFIQWSSMRGCDVEALLAEAMERFPYNLQLTWLRGRTLMSAGKFTEAIPFFERLVECGRTGEVDHATAYDERIFDTSSYESLATCYFRLGRYAESRDYYELAARGEPARLEYRVKQALCSRLLETQSAGAGTS